MALKVFVEELTPRLPFIQLEVPLLHAGFNWNPAWSSLYVTSIATALQTQCGEIGSKRVVKRSLLGEMEAASARVVGMTWSAEEDSSRWVFIIVVVMSNFSFFNFCMLCTYVYVVCTCVCMLWGARGCACMLRAQDNVRIILHHSSFYIYEVGSLIQIPNS